MRLSIIVPVYNVEHYLERCIVSCESQDISSEDYEVIAVNDGSTDNSLSVLNKLAERFHNLMVFSQANRGLSGARMAGLEKARGKYVWFVDSDDWVEENSLGLLLELLEKNELDALQVCAATSKDGVIERYTYSSDSIVEVGKAFIRKHKLVMCVPFTIFRKNFLNENSLSFYEGIFHEDFQFSPRAYYFAQRVMSIHKIVYYYYQNSVSIMRSVNPQKAYDYIVVANSLYDFKENNRDCNRAFCYYISMALNNGLANTKLFDKEQINRLNSLLYNYKYLFKCLLKSNNIKYFIEGLLFYLFPKKVCNSYLFLSRFNKNS